METAQILIKLFFILSLFFKDIKKKNLFQKICVMDSIFRYKKIPATF